MEYFFRHSEDLRTNIKMPLVWGFLLIYLILIYKLRYKRKILAIQLVSLSLIELALFLWYYEGKVLFIREGLPLYHCRIAAFMMAISYFRKDYKLSNYFAWLGIIGTLTAYSFPDPSKYLWPHITNLTYVLGHILSIGSALMILTNERRELDFKLICKITLSMNLMIYLLNKTVSANYGYLNHLPDSFSISLPSPVLYLVISCGLIFLIYGLSKINFRKILKL
ncbi:MAG: TIGR02206 family membrane protein [Anaerococcus prevotii]|uniref:YwaF family protein n=1 Tax=Anaerococcus prevotii TaxID=33034 RepID=UPI0028FE19CB|nr:TIGR02206 family membrane protein [Anaerococcus prevotii]MDU2558922.1 TIGR02206 family membrane protein [Anaerococcus prevotii]